MKFRTLQDCEKHIEQHDLIGQAVAMPEYSEEQNENGTYNILYWFIHYID